jgi:IS5 family transposase
LFSRDSIKQYAEAGVKLVCIPQRSGKISAIFRGRGMKRCRAEGPERFELLVGSAVLANNLLIIAQLMIKKRPARHAA